jgi:hypothetical protein
MGAVKKYRWMELLEGGGLREPEDQGPYYGTESLNDYHGFETEEKAIEAWITFKDLHGLSVPRELVLISFYKLEED